MQNLKKQMTERVCEWGADLVGVADMGRLADIGTRPEDLLDGWPRTACIAVRLADGIVDQVSHGPTALYSQHYSRVNAVLDNIATPLLEGGAHRTLPVRSLRVRLPVGKTENETPARSAARLGADHESFFQTQKRPRGPGRRRSRQKHRGR